MNYRLSLGAGSVVMTLLLASCGGGGSSAGDVNPSAPVTPAAVTGPDSFLLFPNPQVQPDGSLQTNTTAYAQAYYTAIDPTNAKDTLAKWKAANGFDSGTGTQLTAVVGDVRDLGYGRLLTGRKNPDGTIAFMVENYLVEPGSGYGYSTLNLDAATRSDLRWHIGTNGIEYSPGPGGGASFAKFYTFDPVTGARLLAGDLDGRGNKAMPGICINCHGGRGDPLTPQTGSLTGQPLFPLVQNSVSGKRGDTQARLQPLDVGSFDFSTLPGFTRTAQEATLKTFNQWVLCTYPLPAASAAAEDACRPVAGANEWQGSGAVVIKNAYGGDGMPNATFSDTYVPTAWSNAGQTTLYRNVVTQACRTCHILRGTANQSDIEFTTFANFQGYADRIDAHVIDRGNMPLAKIVFDKFWSTGMADTLATFLEGEGYAVRDGAGAVLRPGRPIADPGPSRTVRQGATTLSAAASLYATAYSWSIVSGPAGATLTNPGSAQPTFNATANGTYVLQLVASSSTAQSTPAQLTLVVNNALTPAPSAIRFSDIKTVLGGCTSCHAAGATPLPPIFYTNVDRNGDGVVDATDDLWFYTELRGRINFNDIAASPLLRKPSGNHHNGGLRTGFDASKAPGDPARVNYDLFLNWILNNAPQ